MNLTMKRLWFQKRLQKRQSADEALRRQTEELKKNFAPLDAAVRVPRGLSTAHVARLAEGLRPFEESPASKQQFRRLVSLTAAAAIVALTALTANNALLPGPQPVVGTLESSSTAQSAVNSEASPAPSAPAVSKQAQSSSAIVTAGGYEAVYLALAKIRDKQAQLYESPAGATSRATASMKANAAAPGQNTGGTKQPDAGFGENLGSEEEHGGTNNQVEGVEEADILQNDGKYLYYLNRGMEGSSLQILSANGAGELAKLSELPLNEQNAYPHELMLYRDRLALVYTKGTYAGYYKSGAFIDDGREFTTEESIMNRAVTTVEIYDVSDRKKPKLARTYRQDGGYVSSRLVGADFYLVTSMTSYNLQNLTRENVAGFLPGVKDSANARYQIQPGRISILPEAETAEFTIVSGLKINGSAAPDAQTILGGSAKIYATEKRLYLAGSTYSTDGGTSTSLYAFALENAKISYAAKGGVPGYIKDQFSMDEHGGYFRIATTTTAGGRDNRLYVLDGGLKIAGSITGLAPLETIKSVRFMGDTAHVVTFRQTDPLYVIDLKNPKAPKVMGELKIPGFSEYLHPVSGTLLLGVGKDGNQSQAYGAKLSLFDVKDPMNPREIRKASIGSYNTMILLDSHKAVRYIPSRSLVCIPVIDYADGPASELLVYHVSETDGFTLKARLTGDVPAAEGAGRFHSLPQTYLTRATYTGKALYAFSSRSVLVLNLDSFQKIGGLTLKELQGDYHTGLHTFLSAPPLIYHTPLGK